MVGISQALSRISVNHSEAWQRHHQDQAQRTFPHTKSMLSLFLSFSTLISFSLYSSHVRSQLSQLKIFKEALDEEFLCNLRFEIFFEQKECMHICDCPEQSFYDHRWCSKLCSNNLMWYGWLTPSSIGINSKLLWPQVVLQAVDHHHDQWSLQLHSNIIKFYYISCCTCPLVV